MTDSAPTVLCAIPSAAIAQTLVDHLSHTKCNFRIAVELDEFKRCLNRRTSLVVLGANFAFREAMELCRQLTIPVIVLAEGPAPDPAWVVKAMKLGAEDVLIPPYDAQQLDNLETLIRRDERISISCHSSSSAVTDARNESSPLAPTDDASRRAALRQLEEMLVGRSQALNRIRELIVDVADTAAAVMITGESGTGKELVAQAIHKLSPRATEPFVPVNMAAVPHSLAESLLFGHEKGAFTNATNSQMGWCAMADGGTLFLDEIGEMDLSLQPKLLRFLQEGTVHPVGARQSQKVDVRIITATNRSPDAIIRERILREDLFFRIHVVPIHLPPLRERPEDIAPLADLFLKRAALRHNRPVRRFSVAALKQLECASWPGNVRQLENLVERLVIFARRAEIEPCDFPLDFHDRPHSSHESNGEMATNSSETPSPPLTRMEEKERIAILEALHQAEGHVVTASQMLGVGQATLYRKIKKYAIPKIKRRVSLSVK